MYGINVGFEIGKRALLAQQYSLNLTGHNIANVNTPGFSRQQAILASSRPFASANGNFGTGVDVVTVRNLRSVFLDQQYRQESENLGRWQMLAGCFGQIETIYAEPSDDGFAAVLNSFWNSWQDLAANPDDQAARVAVKEQGLRVINSLQHFASQLRDLQRSLDDDIAKRIYEINNLGRQIADLNEAIAGAELTGHRANDLRDRRDHLIDQLARYVNIQVIEQRDGSCTVQIGAMAFVDGDDVSELGLAVQGVLPDVIHTIKFVDSEVQPKIVRGELAGLIEARDQIVSERLRELDELALALVREINQVHRQGYGLDGQTGRDFFAATTTGAGDIRLDDAIEADVGAIAASANGSRGDNANALAIAALRSKLTMRNQTGTFGDYFESIVGIVGVRAKEAASVAENQEALLAHIEENRQALIGVSLDEEMTNMIKYQHAYEAAARVITTMDEALNTIINNMGLVGR